MTSHERNDDAIVASGTSDAVRKMVRRFVQDDVPAVDEEQAILTLEEEPGCAGVAAYRRLRVRFFAGGVARPAVHASNMSFVAVVIAVAAWRFACPTAWPRMEPAAALAPLSHMLMNGFFFNQGLAISILLGQRSHLGIRVQRVVMLRGCPCEASRGSRSAMTEGTSGFQPRPQ